jgi:DMSO reductase family type II enzyme heme b subunit
MTRGRRAAAVLAAGVLAAWAPPARADVDERGYETEAVAPRAVAAGEVEKGKALYAAMCAQCHGDAGDGMGVARELVEPRPRDFTTGTYKLRHTYAGELPTDEDLFDTIRDGMPGTSMPAWGGLLADAEIWQLVHYVKTFAPGFEKFPPETRVVVGKPRASDEAGLARGREVFDELQCAKCHGDAGRGDGPSAEGLKTDWGEAIWPADLTRPWNFRGGAGPSEIYRTLVTGMSGTPMPSYAPSVSSEDAWHLANYVASLGRAPVRDVVVRGARVPSVPEDPAAPEWRDAPGVDFRLAGQIVQEPRRFAPSVTDLSVKALYDDEQVGLLLSWNDRTEDRAGGEAAPDRVGVQFPAAPAAAGEKPYFLMGDESAPVDHWSWSPGSDSVTCRVGRGMDDLDVRPGAVSARGAYDEGRYQVVLRRTRRARGELEAAFGAGTFLPVAFQVWDGSAGEEGKECAVSAWYYLLLEPDVPRSVLAWPVVVAFLGLAAELWVLRVVRRGGARRAGHPPEAIAPRPS